MFYIYLSPIRINKFIVNILLCSLLAIPTAFAEQENNLIIVRGNHSYPPYEIMSEKGDVTGLHIDIVSVIAKQLGVTVEFKSVPWKRALSMVKHGKADAISYIRKTPTRQEFAIFAEGNVLSYGNFVFFTLTEYKPMIHFTGQLKQLQSYRIGTIMGYDYSTKLNNANYLTIDNKAKSEAALLKRLLHKHFHIGVADKNQIALLAHQKGISEQVTYLSPALSIIPQYIAFSRIKKHDLLAEKFAQALREFKKTSEYQALLTKYSIKNE